MARDSKLELSVNSVRMFWRVKHFRTCSREEMSIIIVTTVHGVRPYRDDCLASPCLFLVQNTKTGAQNMHCLHFNSASSRKDYEISWRWEEGGWVEVREGGGGEGAGRQQRITSGRQMSRQNHPTNITTITFLTQHKTKTATTAEISQQYLKINDKKKLVNARAKVCKHRQLMLVIATAKIWNADTEAEKFHTFSLPRCRCYPEGLYLNSQKRF